MNPKKKISDFRKELQRQHGVVVFFIVLILSNILWKILFRGDANHIYNVSFLGLHDISSAFAVATTYLTKVVVDFLQLFGLQIFANDTYIAFANGTGVQVIWGCTAIKQMFIFACIILCSRGAWKHKAWFIPTGWILIHWINVIRIASLALISQNHIEYVNFYHIYVFKYAFYGIIFLIWVVWDLFFAERRG